MSKLDAKDAAGFAAAAYAPINNTVTTPQKATAAILGGNLRQRYDVMAGSDLDGVTGRNLTANFGFTAMGKGSDQGNCVVAIRGTNFSSLDDWLTNARMAGARSSSGYPVHAGFNSLANTLLPQVRSAIKGKNISNLHILGHSLGGAAATLLADALNDVANVHLYTFGAPRAGTIGHAQYLTSELGAQNIFRVYHDTDLVPMVPVFPYSHMPAGDNGYLMKGSGTIVSIAAHSIELYKTSCRANWSGMKTIPHRRFSLDTVDDLLAEAGQIPGGFMQVAIMRLITKVLSLMLTGAGGIIGTGLFVTATVMDQLAIAIMRGVQLGLYLADTVESLVRQIMRFLGLTLTTGVKVTTAFLRWLLDKLFSVISMMARAAVQTIS